MAIAAESPGDPKSARGDKCQTSANFRPGTIEGKAGGVISDRANLGPNQAFDQAVTYEAAIEVLKKVGHDDLADKLYRLKHEHLDLLRQFGAVKGSSNSDRADSGTQSGRQRGFGRARVLGRGRSCNFVNTRFCAPKPKDPVAVLPLPVPEPTPPPAEPIIPPGTGPRLGEYLRTRNEGVSMPTWSCSCPSCFGYEKHMQELEGRVENDEVRKKEVRKINEMATRMVLSHGRGAYERVDVGTEGLGGKGEIGDDVKELIEGVIACRLSREKKTK
ncbi:hypothetical protein FB567DRAFT_555402 [Paraphoma chrysanthemicola]|uniref:Uncharacterized protein n=1 Tax=Paraphoma chrysanthemicola TaxID=798071 RepID=A0A8K0VRB7_9PLEO|nr:hypothetical protein FB567DRAFT_555402 [Paraphoma chrysanthemicola]